MSASVPFSIPRDSPLASGWRAAVVFALERHGLHDVLDTLAAYAELRTRHEPDDCSAAEESAQGSWWTWRAAAQRRIEALEEPYRRQLEQEAGLRRRPGRPRIEDV